MSAEKTVLQNVSSRMRLMGWLLFDAVVTIILGIMIFTGFPLAGTVAIGVFLGIKLVFVGVTMLTIRSAAKRAF